MRLRRDPWRRVLGDTARRGLPCCVASTFGEDGQRPTSHEGRGTLLGPGSRRGAAASSALGSGWGRGTESLRRISSRLEVSSRSGPEEDTPGVSSRPGSSPASWLGLRQAPLGGWTLSGHPRGFGVLMGRSTEPAGGREWPVGGRELALAPSGNEVNRI